MNYSDYIIFVDESGDHSLECIDVEYPVFVLDFCVFRKDFYTRDLIPELHAFKFDHFGHDIVILHEQDIRKQKFPFVFLKNLKKRNAFMSELNSLIDRAEFTIIATVIDKQKYAKEHAGPVNPYDLALRFCMEQAYTFLQGQQQHKQTTHIVVERRGKREDRELAIAFRKICADAGYRSVAPSFEIVFADKRSNSAGLQLADLTARPIGRHVISTEQPNRAWDIIEQKLYRDSASKLQGRGLKVFP